MYMIYFDQIDENRFGSIRQQIWALLHFPLHISILVTNEGSRAFVLYSVAKGIYTQAFHDSQASKLARTTSEIIDVLKGIVSTLTRRLKNKGDVPDFKPIYQNITAIKDGKTSAQELEKLLGGFTNRVFIWVMQSFGVEVESSGSPSAQRSIDEQIDTLSEKFFVVFRFFFIAAGFVLISMALLHWFSKSRKSRGEVMSIIMTTLIGAGLSLVSIMALTDDGISNSTFSVYLNSGWIVPTVVLAYGLGKPANS